MPRTDIQHGASPNLGEPQSVRDAYDALFGKEPRPQAEAEAEAEAGM